MSPYDRYQCSDPHDRSNHPDYEPGATCSICGSCVAEGAEVAFCPGSVNGPCPDEIELCENHMFDTAGGDKACQRCDAVNLAYCEKWVAS